MKKVLVCLFICLFIVSGFNNQVFADDYVPSIGATSDVSIKDVEPKSDGTYEIKSNPSDDPSDGTNVVVLTPYPSKTSIKDSTSQNKIEEAYAKIVEAETVSSLNDKILTYAHRNCSTCVVEENLVIKDLFDITAYDVDKDGNYTVDTEKYKTDGTGNDRYFEIQLTVDEMQHFVCLLHYKNGQFEIVEDKYLTFNNDTHIIKVKLNDLSPFAVVLASKFTCEIDDTDAEDSNDSQYKYPKTDISVVDNDNCIYHYLIIGTLLVTIIFTLIISKKGCDNRISNIIYIFNLILCNVFYILGNCKLDLYALIIDIVFLVIIYIYNYAKNKK